MTRRLSASHPAASRRRGFSMIELLIVITIIAILAGLLLAAVNAGISRARVAQVVAEMKNLEQAVKQFSSELGVEPPSYIILHEFAGVNTGWNLPNAETRTSRALIRQIWKDFDFNTPVDLNRDGNADTSFRLNGAECLVFFLGGRTKVDPTGVITTTGFSKVPTAPFGTTTGSSWGPYYEFNSRQFVDLDGDGFQEYRDAIPGQSKPIQYLSSYAGQGYRPYGLDGVHDTDDDELIRNSMLWVYTRTAGSSVSSPGEVHNPKTFQLISPGFDGEYGVGGIVDPETGVKDMPTTAPLYLPGGNTNALNTPNTTVIRIMPNTQYERDNITNFLPGELH